MPAIRHHYCRAGGPLHLPQPAQARPSWPLPTLTLWMRHFCSPYGHPVAVTWKRVRWL